MPNLGSDLECGIFWPKSHQIHYVIRGLAFFKRIIPKLRRKAAVFKLVSSETRPVRPCVCPARGSGIA